MLVFRNLCELQEATCRAGVQLAHYGRCQDLTSPPPPCPAHCTQDNSTQVTYKSTPKFSFCSGSLSNPGLDIQPGMVHSGHRNQVAATEKKDKEAVHVIRT